MSKILYKPLTWLFTVLILFSSCGSLGFEKRYHNGGFQISFRKAGNDKKIDANTTRKTPKTSIGQRQLPDAEIPASIASSAEQKVAPSIESPEIDATKSAVNKNQVTGIPHSIQTFKLAEKAMKSESTKVKAQRSDIPQNDIIFILYFILCLAIPPLAYYLIKEDTDTLFWICLLCYLFTFTWLTGFQFGLLGIVSVVIALLALLNKI
jgi:hypothetical protein